MDEQLKSAALEYHRLPRPGKISVTPTKALVNQRDLALAYSPGVAAACNAIAADANEARSLTSARPSWDSATSGRSPASR
jgi:malate dehydrogenase (oxaloacetate-decarboxylating)(NADP+)